MTQVSLGTRGYTCACCGGRQALTVLLELMLLLLEELLLLCRTHLLQRVSMGVRTRHSAHHGRIYLSSWS